MAAQRFLLLWGIPVPTDVWLGWLKNIILEHLLSAMCLVCNSTHIPVIHHCKCQIPQWMDGESLCIEYHDCPPSPSLSAQWRVKWLTKWLTTAADVPGTSKKCRPQVSIYWPLEEPATTLCTLDQNTSWSQKRGWSIWLPKRGAHLVPATQYLGIQPRRICDFFLSSLIIFPCPTMPGLGLGFLGTFHAWFILRVPGGEGDSSCGVTEDTTTSSLLIQTPSRQRVHVLLPTTSEHLRFNIQLDQNSDHLILSVLWFPLPLAPSFLAKN